MAAQQKETIIIPKAYRPEEREAIAIDILEYIRERTENGRDKNEKSFGGYSKKYSESRDFKIAGKSKNKVDLKLTGDMMDLLDVLKTSSGKIIIGYEKGDEVNGKVEGNRLGTYGQSKKVGPKRDFLGIKETKLKEILSKYPIDDKEDRMERVSKVLTASKEAENYDEERDDL